jgi:TM2 domain-containing membrane protein YozV
MSEDRVDILGIFNARNIVFLAMLAVGALCIFTSARNTAAYLLLTGMDSLIAIMTGIALIVFSSTSFTAAQLFLAQKGAAKLFSLLFVIVGLLVITFSIFSTLSLNYSKFLDSEAIQADIADKIEKRRSEIMAEYQASEVETEGQDVTQWTMQNIDRLLTMAEQSGESWNNSMRTVMESAQSLASTEQEKRQTIDEILENIYVETIPRTFFGFMLGLHTLDKKYFFDFFMIAIPAIFYDIIAPLAMTVVLLLMGFKSKKENETGVAADVTTTVPPSKPKEEPPDVKDLTAYIESAMQEGYQILPDDQVPNMDAERCAKFRTYLSSFIYKGNPLISERDGQFVSLFDKVNILRFITLQNNIKRVEEAAE